MRLSLVLGFGLCLAANLAASTDERSNLISQGLAVQPTVDRTSPAAVDQWMFWLDELRFEEFDGHQHCRLRWELWWMSFERSAEIDAAFESWIENGSEIQQSAALVSLDRYEALLELVHSENPCVRGFVLRMSNSFLRARVTDEGRDTTATETEAVSAALEPDRARGVKVWKTFAVAEAVPPEPYACEEWFVLSHTNGEWRRLGSIGGACP